MNLSLAAKAAWPGIWTEADDHGVFEWKPVTLKAKLLPADNVDMAALLAETLKHGLTIQFAQEGKQYGVIKGFIRWQRPKKPKYRHPFPKAAEIFATNSSTCSPPVPHQSETGPGIGAQREEEGGMGEPLQGSPPDENQTSPPAAARGAHEAPTHDTESVIAALASRKRA